jgi:probable HAF family extracellular repeat protein
MHVLKGVARPLSHSAVADHVHGGERIPGGRHDEEIAVVIVGAAIVVGIGLHAQVGESVSTLLADDNHVLVSTIAFWSTRHDPTGNLGVTAEIYLMDPDGTNVRRVTVDGIYADFFPALRPDGRKVVFDSNRLRTAEEPPNTSDLFVMNTDGTEQTYLRRGSSATWDPDSKYLALHASASGTGLPIRPDAGAPAADSDLFVLNVDDFLGNGVPARSLTNTPDDIEEDAEWLPTPGGRTIVYTRHPNSDLPTVFPFVYSSKEIYVLHDVLNPDSTEVPVQLTMNSEEERAPAWSSDGTHIAYMCRRGPPFTPGGALTFEICVMNADGTGQTQLTFNSVQDASPSWSPDDKKIVFQRGAAGTGQLQIWVMNLNPDGTTTETPITNTPGRNELGRWGSAAGQSGGALRQRPLRRQCARPSGHRRTRALRRKVMKRHVVSVAALLMALIVPQHSVTAANPGSITDLGTLGGDYSDAFGINNDGALVQVVGRSRTASGVVHAFLWTAPGPMIDLGGLDGCTSYANDINNHGQIAGESNDILRQRWAVVWTNAGATGALEKLPTQTGACCSAAYGINKGSAGDPSTVSVAGSSQGHAVVWRRSATRWTIQDLGALPGDTYSFAHDVNDEGDVVGSSSTGASGASRGFLWTAATGMLPLSSLGGETYALAINNGGDVAGLSTDASGNRHAVRWRSATNWTLEDLGTLGGCCSEGYGITGAGDVVGVSNVSQRLSGSQHAFLANAAGMMDIGALRGDSWARDMNDFGVVVGGGSTGRSIHALLWQLP